jgi:hypothetical protein
MNMILDRYYINVQVLHQKQIINTDLIYFALYSQQ